MENLILCHSRRCAAGAGGLVLAPILQARAPASPSIRRCHLHDLLRAPFLGYEKSTGKNPAANLKALLGVCSLCLSSVVSSCSILLLGTAILLSISIASAKLDGEVHGWQPRPTEIKCTLDLSCNRTQF